MLHRRIARTALAAVVFGSTVLAQGAGPWIRSYDGPGHGADVAVDLALGRDGDVLAAATSQGAQDADGLFLAYDAAGIPRWERRVDLGGTEYGLHVAYDDANRAVYALVTRYAGATYAGFALLRLDPANGAVVWQRDYDGPAHQGARGASLAVDATGGILVGGVLGADISGSALVVRFDAAGATTWTWTNPIRSVVENLTPAANGGVALHSRSFFSTGGAMHTIERLDPAGATIWSRDVGATENGFHGPLFDSQSNVVYSVNVPMTGGRVIAKLDAAGNLLWSADAVAIFGANNSTLGLAVGRQDEVYAGGTSMQIVRLEPGGAVGWLRTVPTTSWFDFGSFGGLALAPDGDVVLRLRGHVSPDFEDFDSVLSWSPSGDFLWSQAVRAADPDEDARTYGLAVTRTGSVVIAGSQGPENAGDVLVASIRQQSTAFCHGDGSAGPCPCGNEAPAPGGCRRGSIAVGVRLDDQGVASLTTDTLRFFGSFLPANGFCALVQGSPTATGVPFQDGLLCLNGRLARIFVGNANGQFADVPPASAGTISAMSRSIGIVIAPGETLGYQLYFRGPNVCAPGNANLSSGIRVTWSL